MAKFTVFFDGECINTHIIDEPVISIGRLPENTISIANMGISRRHAKIEEDADRQYIITDLNSLNGTYVNGKRIKKTNLYNNDKITIGKYSILYEAMNHHENPERKNDSIPVIEDVNLPGVSESVSTIEEKMNTLEPASEQVFESGIIMEADSSANGDFLLTDDSLISESDENKQLTGEAVLIETNKHVVYKLDKAVMTMGSGDNDDIYVSGFMISEGQVSIEKNEEGYEISVNKSIGKFKINSKSAKTHLLRHKDRIEIGSSTFRYMENG